MLERLLRAFGSQRAARAELKDAFRLYNDAAHAQAVAACETLIARGVSVPEAHYLLGLIAQRQGRIGDAIASLQRAVQAAPGDPAYSLTLGNLLAPQAPHEALPLLERGVQLAEGGPVHADALTDLGKLYAHLGRGEEAEQAYRDATDIAPGNSEALRAHADLLWQQSDTEPARGLASRIGRRSDPAARLRRALMLPVIVESTEHIDAVRLRFERELDELLADPVEPLPAPETSIGMTAFYIAYHGRNDRPLAEKLGRVVRRCFDGAGPPLIPPRPARKRRRVGFVSTYFQQHSIARTTVGWIRDLPREHFEVYVVSIAPGVNDPRAEEIRRAADHYLGVPATLGAARSALLAAELDYLVFADIGMHPLTYYLAYCRLAPVQLAAWGHPVTTGIDTIDYFISAQSLETAGSEAQYSERLLRLGGYFMPRYAKPEWKDDAPDRSAFGLPGDAHVYGCPQTLFKLHPDFDEALIALLERDPRGHVVMIEANAHWARKIRRRLEQRSAGVTDRLRFVPPQSSQGFLNLLACSDVLLDPFHFGGNNSTMEGLALGVPIVTLPAAFLRGRFTLGHYQEMGYLDCVADRPERYVELALRLACEPGARDAARREILRASPALFDRPDAGHALGEALLGIAAQR